MANSLHRSRKTIRELGTLQGIPQADILACKSARTFAQRFCYTAHVTDSGVRADLFPAYEYLDAWWDAFDAHDDVVLAKTRQMTVSWAVMAGYLYELLFRFDSQMLVISRKEKLVDDGGGNSTYASLLGKIRFMYDRLPEWMRRDAPLEFSFLKIHNPATGSSVIGESSSPRAGAGASFRRAVLDEAAFIPRSEQVFGAVRSACPNGLALVSTPDGKGNLFYRLWSSDTSRARVIRMHWSEHPGRRCDCAPGEHRGCWYARQLETMTPLQVARELDISFEASVAGRVWYGWSDDFVADVPMLDGPTIWRGWDFGVGDQTAIICAQVVPLELASGRTVKQLRIFDAYRNSEQGALHYRDILQSKAARYNGGGTRDYGDPYNLRSRDSNLTSWQQNLADDRHPYKIRVEESGCRGVPDEDVIDNARKFMQVVECADGKRRSRLLVDRKLRALIACFEGWSYPTDDEGRVTGDSPKPRHDEMSHWMCAYKYLAWAVDPLGGPPDSNALRESCVVSRDEIFAGEVW